MHTGKRLAMLNPKNCRFDVGSGGIPEVVSEDVAHALGRVDAGIGREVLCLIWWPDGARLTAKDLDNHVDAMMRDEWMRREAAMLDALLAVAIGGSKGQAKFSTAHLQRWPKLAPADKGIPVVAKGYEMVRNGVLKEIADAGLCPDCAGRGVAFDEVGARLECTTCAGEGHHRLSDRGRAKACGFESWEKFRDRWMAVYDWVFQQCMDDLHKAERQFHYALS
jgi:hypothetical protein